MMKLFRTQRTEFTTVSEFIDGVKQRFKAANDLKAKLHPYTALVIMMSELEQIPEMNNGIEIKINEMKSIKDPATEISMKDYLKICTEMHDKTKALGIDGLGASATKASRNQFSRQSASTSTSTPTSDGRKDKLMNAPPPGKYAKKHVEEWKNHKPSAQLMAPVLTAPGLWYWKFHDNKIFKENKDQQLAGKPTEKTRQANFDAVASSATSASEPAREYDFGGMAIAETETDLIQYERPVSHQAVELPSINLTEPRMPLPPANKQYNDPELALEEINDLIKDSGYAVTSRRTKTTKRGVKKTVRICCDRGRTNPHDNDDDPDSEASQPSGNQRKTTTIAADCPFSVSLRFSQLTNTWIFTIENESHNHGPSPASTHNIQRKLEVKRKLDIITQQLKQGPATRQIITSLRESDPNSCIIPKDINNLRMQLNREFLNGRTPIQALLQELPKDGNWIFKYELDDDQHVTALFCMHKTCVTMLQSNPWVISMDCTYKTNQYKLPLLDIVGFTATGSTVYLGFAFIRDEKQDTYEVVLSCLAEAYDSLGLEYPRTILTDKEDGLIAAIESVFPTTKSMVCIWHINMAILKKARPLLSEQIRQAISQANSQASSSQSRKTKAQISKEIQEQVDKAWKKMLKRWNRIVYATTPEEKDRQWEFFKENYKDPIYEPLLRYLEDEWLESCPERFLHIHTSKYLHLNERATSRAESAHWLLKHDLHVSTNDLLVVLRCFERVVQHQFDKVQADIASEKIRQPTKPHPLYKLITTKISRKVIQQMKNTYDRYLPETEDKPPIPPVCSCDSKNTKEDAVEDAVEDAGEDKDAVEDAEGDAEL
ncbi:hypothetical protein N7505_007283 [Penicillium chrysogenum]|uniref:MULE transposase domain-containing protein n=1 Tax=Penicillium chrysogenum TaxID=5076 RepID=A0ABQ8WDK3_PENCH|nr:hypothetical protein N7505_007283 [Penicillium chrysogenum]